MADEMKKDDKKPKVVKVGDILAKEKMEKPKGESKSSAKDAPKKPKHKHTHIEHHYDAAGKSTGHTVRHQPMEGGQEVSYAAPDLDAVHDGLEEHIGSPNADEAPEQPAQPQQQQAV